MAENQNYEKTEISISNFKELLRNTFRITSAIWSEKKGLILLITFLVLIDSAVPFLQSGSRGLMINELVNVAGSGTITAGLLWLIALVIVAGITQPLFSAFQSFLSKVFWYYLEEKFEIDLIKKKGEIDVAIHESPEHNDLFNKVSENGTFRIRSFTDRQFFILQNLIEVILASAVILFLQWWIFMIILIGTVPELVTEIRYGRGVWGIHSGRAEVRRKYWDLRSHFHHLPSIVELKLFQNIPHFISIIRDLFKSFQTQEKENERKKLRYQLLAITVSQAVNAFAVTWFIIEVVRGDLLVGTMTFAVASIGSLRQSLSGLFANLGRQYQDSLFVTDIFKLLDLKPVIKPAMNAVILGPQKTPEIIFENVSFSYPGVEKPVLRDISLTIAAGEKLAIVGVNGAGKTTFVKLLCRFFDPTKGRILVDGHDLRDIDLESWYHHLGVIFQDYSNYRFMVKEAIGVGRTEVPRSFEKIKESAAMSEAHMFIEKWSNAYEQTLGKEFTGGIEPSIGQWQKLALAKTFYRDPHVLILDEPTSSIDAEAEAKIFEKLEALPKDRSVILISHRFSTVRKAQKIAVIAGGELSEYGTHEELLKRHGIYARLFTVQAKSYQ